MNNTKTILLTVDKNQTPIQIADVLENFYFDGDVNSSEESHLVGTVLIGNIPLPEVVMDDTKIKIIAPYVDFKEKMFLFSPEQKEYIQYSDDFVPEIWHGIIPSFNDEAFLKSYFDNLHNQYINNNIKNNVVYADFVHEENSFDDISLQQYINNTDPYSEEIAYKKFTAKMLGVFTGKLTGLIFEEESDLQKSIKEKKDQFNEGHNPWGEFPNIKDYIKPEGLALLSDPNLTKGMPDIMSAQFIKKYLPEFVKSVQSYIAELYDNVEGSGKWSQKQTKFLAQTITLRDSEVRTGLKAINIVLQKKITEFIENNWQQPIQIDTSEKSYGRDSSYINSAEDCTWYRGSWVTKNSQMIEMNRTFDTTYAGICKDGHSGCCVENMNAPNKCDYSDASLNVVSIGGSILSSRPTAPSYLDCAIVNSNGKTISSMFLHNEPRNETIRQHIESNFTKNLPIDGIHYVDFQGKNKEKVTIKLPNLFKVKGSVLQFLKDESSIINNFNQDFSLDFLSNIFSEQEIKFIEDLVQWNNFSINKKYKQVLLDTVFQSNSKNKKELLYLRSNILDDGSLFAQMNSNVKKNKDIDDDMYQIWIKNQKNTEITNNRNKSSLASGDIDDEWNSECGAADGVVLWEWPAAVMCWLDELQNWEFFDTEQFDKTMQDFVENMEDSVSEFGTDFESIFIKKKKSENGESVLDQKEGNKNITLPDNFFNTKIINAPKNVTLIYGQKNTHKSSINIYLSDKGNLTSQFNEITILPSEDILILEKDINSQKEGIQIPVLGGMADIVLYTNSLSSSFITLQSDDYGEVKININKVDEKDLFVKSTIGKIITKGEFSVAEITFDLNKTFYGDYPLYFTENSYYKFFQKSVTLKNGHGTALVFFKNQQEEIDVKVTSPIFNYSFKLPSVESSPTMFVTKKDKYYAQTEEVFKFDVLITDSYLNQYNKPFEFKLFVTPNSNKFTPLKSRKIFSQNGKIEISVPIKDMSGEINIALMAEGMKTKLIKIYTGLKISSGDITKTPFAFMFFVEEGVGNSFNIIKNSLKSGVLSLAHKKYLIPNQDLYKFNVNSQGGVSIYDDNIIIEDLGNFKLSLYDQSTLEHFIVWKLNLELPAISSINQDADIFIKALKPELFFIDENNNIFLNELKIAEVSNNGVYVLDNRFNITMSNDHNKIIYNINYDGLTVVQVFVKSNSKKIIKQSLNVQIENNNQFVYKSNIKSVQQFNDGIGWKGEDLSILHSSSAMSFGKSFMHNQTISDTFYGDPVMSFNIQDENLTEGSFDKSIGKLIYKDTENLSKIKSLDFNKDGIVDIVIKKGRNKIALLQGTESGEFIERWDYALVANGISDLATGDFSGDGYDDILIGTKERGVLYYFNNKNGDINPEVELIKVDAKQVNKVDAYDFDHDGRKDIVVSTSRGQLIIYYGSSLGFVKGQIIDNFGISLTNQNATSDLFATDIASYKNYLVYFQGKAYEMVNYVDLNNDGKKDIRIAAQSNDIFFATEDGYFQNDKQQFLLNSGGGIYSKNSVRESKKVLFSIKPTSGQAVNKQVPINNIIGEKYYYSKVSSPLDKGDIVTVKIHVPKNQIKQNNFVVDTLPFVFDYINNSEQCSIDVCKKQSAEKDKIVFGPFMNITEDFYITYKVKVKDSVNVDFIVNKENSTIIIPAIGTVYFTNSSRTWSSDLIKNKKVVIDTPKTEENTKIKFSLTDSLSSMWGMVNNNQNSGNNNSGNNNSNNNNGNNKEISEELFMYDYSVGDNGDLMLSFKDDLSETTAQLDETADYIENLTCSKNGCAPLPLNMAFLVPGAWGITLPLDQLSVNVGCGIPPLALDKMTLLYMSAQPRLPICITPVTPFVGISEACYSNASIIKFYISPTLSGGLGTALCWGNVASYNTTILDKAILGQISSQGKSSSTDTSMKCFVTSIPLSTQEACDKITQDVNDFADKINSMSTSGNESVVNVDGGNTSGQNNKGGAGLNMSVGVVSRNWVSLNDKGQSTLTNGKSLFARWWDAQLEQFANLLSIPTVTIYYPAMDAVLFGGIDDEGNEIENKDSLSGKFDKALEDYNKDEKDQKTTSNKNDTKDDKDNEGGSKIIADLDDEEKDIRDNQNIFIDNTIGNTSSIFLDKQISNLEKEVLYHKNKIKEFSKVEKGIENVNSIIELMKNMPFLSVERESINITIPWIDPFKLSEIIAELEAWLLINELKIRAFVDEVTELAKGCGKDLADISTSLANTSTDSFDVDVSLNMKDIEKNYQYCNEKINIKAALELSDFLSSIKQNIETLKQYRDFPKQLVKYKTLLSSYMSDVLRFVNKLIGSLFGWISRNMMIVDKYYKFIYDIMALFDLFDNINLAFKDLKDCKGCTVDTNTRSFDLMAMILAMIPTPPVVQIQKFPDIIMDFSHLSLGAKIIIPDLNFKIKEIPFDIDLETLNIPDLSLDIDLELELPEIPQLPELPELPDLPAFPELPGINLPDLPPPPKLPADLSVIGDILDALRPLFKIYCLITTGMFVYNESELTKIIEALTMRSSQPFISFDYSQLICPNASCPWIDSINVDGYLSIEADLNTNVFIEPLEEKVDNFIDELVDQVNDRRINNILNSPVQELNQAMQEGANKIQNNIDEKTNEIKDDIENSNDRTNQKIDEIISYGERLIPIKANLQKFIDNNSNLDLSVSHLEKFRDSIEKIKNGLEEDINILEKTNNLIAINSVSVSQDFVNVSQSSNETFTLGLTGTNNVLTPSSLLNIDTDQITTQDDVLSVVNTTLNDINEQNTAGGKHITKGLYYFNKQTNTKEQIVFYEEISEDVIDVEFIDYDKDGDKDIFYIIENKLFLKKSYINNSLNKSFSYKTQIGNIDSYNPNYRSVNYLEASSSNNIVDISWLDAEDSYGYLLERKTLVDGFDIKSNSNTDYIFLLKDDLFTEESELNAGSTISFGNVSYKLEEQETAKVEYFNSPYYSWEMDNDFYYLKIFSLTKEGLKSTASKQIILAPQISSDKTDPFILSNSVSHVPVLKEWPISVGQILDESPVKYLWDLDKNGVYDYEGKVYNVPPQEKLSMYKVNVKIEDEAGNFIKVNKKINVYSPEIKINKYTSSVIEGEVVPAIPLMPFVLVKERDGQPQIIEPVNGDRFYTDINGKFIIGDQKISKGTLIKDKKGDLVANIDSYTGLISLNKNNKIIAVPATKYYPTEVLVISENNKLVGRISYISSGNQVEIVSSSEEFKSSNVSIIDLDQDDTINISQIDNTSKYFANGVMLVSSDKKALAAVSPQGAIRLLDSRLQLFVEQQQDKISFFIKNLDGEKIVEIHIGVSKDKISLNTNIDSKKSLLEIILPTAFAEETSLPFSDININHPYYEAIKELYEKNILKGYGDGTVHPDAKITRAEFVKIALGATMCFDCSAPDDDTKNIFKKRKPFPDVNLPDWFYYCVSIAKKEKMVKGYGDGMYHPNKNISRKEAVAILLRQIDAEIIEMPENYFRDIPEYDWAKDYIYTAVNLGLIKNLNGFIFPNEEISRGEFSMMAKMVLNIRDCQSGIYKDTNVEIISDKYINEDKPSDKVEDDPQENMLGFSGICEELNGGICPDLSEVYVNKGFIVEPAENSIYPDIKSKYPIEKSKCISINDVNVLNGDIIYAMIISSDSKIMFSKSNKVKINNEN